MVLKIQKFLKISKIKKLFKFKVQYKLKSYNFLTKTLLNQIN